SHEHHVAVRTVLLQAHHQMHDHALALHVGHECHLARSLDSDRDLLLLAPARPGDSARADLALLGHVAPQLVVVLVVDLFDLLLAEVTALPPERTGRLGRPPTGAALLLSLCHSVSLDSWVV